MRTRNLKDRAIRTTVAVALVLPLLLAASGWAYDGGKFSRLQERHSDRVSLAATPIQDERIHYVGEVWMTLANRGSIGSSHGAAGRCTSDMELIRINWCPSFEYPGGSRIDYLFDGGFWFGGVRGADTLVSAAYSQSGGNFEFNSFSPMMEGLPPGFSAGCGAFGEGKGLEQVYWCLYTDTIITPSIAGSHTPMGLEVLQLSHQSSDNFARNFIIVDLYVTNVSQVPIQDFYAGVFLDCDAYYIYQGGTPYLDDISGFLSTWPNSVDPRFRDTLMIAWSADNDGDPENGHWARSSARSAMGWRFLRIPEGADVSFNWWTSASGAGNLDWGPRRAIDLRELGTGGQGTPQGDRNGYHFMRNKEIDYGQLESGIDHSADGWKPPPGALVCNLADGADTRSLLSAGPEKLLEPGETVAFTLAFIAGEDLHRYPDNIDNWSCDNPARFIADLDFSSLAKNAWWAGFVFDNFGVDTDKNGYAGEFYKPVKDFDTVFYTGDGCPDFSGPAPPKGPGKAELSLVSHPKVLEVTWTGANSELKVDPLLRANDFEGYKVYIAERNSPDDIPSSGDYSLIASWDIIDYRRYTYEPRAGIWEISSHPKTADQWREEFKNNPYADPNVPFDPLDYPAPTLENAYAYPVKDQYGQTFPRYAYFEPQDFNQGDTITIGDTTIANVIQRIEVRDTVVEGEAMQYGIYRVVLDKLLPSRHYFISVTAFDFGDPANNLDPLETTPGVSRVDGIPIYSADVVEDYWNQGGVLQDSVRVIVYPNPYKSSFIGPKGNRISYREQGFEGRHGQEVETIGDEERRIHFINLPKTARIRIYTLDGDLIRELNHPDRILSSYTSKISWDLISRNTQAVESGIYIYRVDSEELDEPQIGKIVIIK